MGSTGLGAKAMDGLSWGLVGAVGWVVPALGWLTPPAKLLAGRRFVPGEVSCGTSSAGVGQQLFKGMHGFASPTQHLLGAKRLAVPWPCCPLLAGFGDPFWRVMPGGLVTSAVLG